MSLINPAGSANTGCIQQDCVDTLDRAVQQAIIAQLGWAKKPFGGRADSILAMRDFVVAEADRIAGVIAKSTG